MALSGPAAAWGTSVNIAAVDDQGPGNCGSNVVCSSQMGGVSASSLAAQGMTGTITRVEPGNINAATLANYDTVLLFNCNPNTIGDKTALVNWIKNGGKVVIWDAEDQYYECNYGACWDYSWLPGSLNFGESVPGAQGANGLLAIVEENQLSQSNSGDPYYIDVNHLSQSTDAAGDANVFTNFVTQDWCIDMTAKNYLQITGPVHVYSKGPTSYVGSGIVIFSGLDWDYAGYYGDPWMYKMMAQEFNANSLPCGYQITGTLDVTKTADKASYQVGDPMTFTVTVKNNAPITAEDVTVTDVAFSPYIECDQTQFDVGDLAAGATSAPITVTCTVKDVPTDCQGENSAKAVGYYQGAPIFFGSDKITFGLFPAGATTCPGIPTPEFPSLAVPVAMILGSMFVVYMLRPRKD